MKWTDGRERKDNFYRLGKFGLSDQKAEAEVMARLLVCVCMCVCVVIVDNEFILLLLLLLLLQVLRTTWCFDLTHWLRNK